MEITITKIRDKSRIIATKEVMEAIKEATIIALEVVIKTDNQIIVHMDINKINLIQIIPIRIGLISTSIINTSSNSSNSTTTTIILTTIYITKGETDRVTNRTIKIKDIRVKDIKIVIMDFKVIDISSIITKEVHTSITSINNIKAIIKVVKITIS